MKKYLLLTLLGISGISFADTPSPQAVTFSGDSTITSINFVYNNEYDASGEFASPINTYLGASILKITTQSSNSEQLSSVAETYSNEMNDNGHYMEAWQNALYTTPDQLSFWFGGTLYINGESMSEPIYLGQGKDILGFHNWWIGSFGASENQNKCPIGGYDTFISLTGQQTNTSYFVEIGSDDSFYVTKNLPCIN